MAVPLPSSEKAPYHIGYWLEIEEKLTNLQKHPSVDLLVVVILEFMSQAKSDRSKYFASCAAADEKSDFDDLKTLLFILLKEPDTVSVLIPVICGIALELPKSFPSNQLKILTKEKDGQVTLSRRQVACLVAHMFFCTIRPCSHMMRQGYIGQFVGDGSPNGPITFQYWHTLYQNPTKLYLTALITYFKELSETILKTLDTQFITFTRKCLRDEPEWEQSGTDIIKVIPNLKGRIGDVEGHVEIDFANEDVGFGTTGTQEELLLGTSPESTVIVLFNETLLDRDAVMIKGAKKYANYEGYGLAVEFAGVPENTWNWENRVILAMDAYCYIGDEKVQLENKHMKRELNKAYCALSMVHSRKVDSGHLEGTKV